jgi:O-succinylbenzoic acid--CoA ligase
MVTEFNTAFSFNGLPISYADLSEVAYSLVKEGDPYEREIGDFLLDWISGSEHILQRTSGSTGSPREINLSKKAMVKSALLTGGFLDLGKGTRALLCLPVSSIAGKMMLVRAMTLGWELTVVAPERTPLWSVTGVFDFAAMVPMQLQASLNNIGRVRKVLVGGAPVSKELREALSGKNTIVYESYGMSETASHIALRKLHPPDNTGSPGEVPAFQALPGITLEQDKNDCLVVHVPFLSKEPIQTNDLVSMQDEHSFYWLGRADHIVNSGGVKLVPELLEAQLEPIVQRRFFLTGIPDKVFGEKLVLVAEGKPDEGLLAKVQDSGGLEKYEVPKAVYFVDAFQEGKSGKIQRAEIRRELFKSE